MKGNKAKKTCAQFAHWNGRPGNLNVDKKYYEFIWSTLKIPPQLQINLVKKTTCVRNPRCGCQYMEETSGHLVFGLEQLINLKV